jgi:hypothetical protein
LRYACRFATPEFLIFARPEPSSSTRFAYYPGRTVVAVTHAGFIVTSFLMLFGVPRPGTGARIDPDPASLTTWEYDEVDHVWRLVSYNDTAHLTRAAAPTPTSNAPAPAG